MRFLSVCFVLLLLAGCAGQPQPPRPAAPGFPLPTEEAGVTVIPAAEALGYIERLRTEPRLLADWQPLDFALFQSLRHARSFDPDQPVLLLPAAALAALPPETSPLSEGAPAMPTPAAEAPGMKPVTYGQLARTLQHLMYLLPTLAQHPERLVTDFFWIRLGPDFRFTGYYEPTIQASPVRTARFCHPIYRTPPELTKVRKTRKYYTREDIDTRGVLAHRRLELAWAEDPVDIYFLQVQGSGRLVYANGTVRNILYDAQNGHAYRSLGRELIDRGLLPEKGVTMFSIRDWLAAHPEQTQEMLNANPSYVFFRLGEEEIDGSYGSMGRVLTPWASVAADQNVLPNGLLTYMSVLIPDKASGADIPFQALMLPQDSGGAIRRHRVDIFFGNGPEAEYAAGCLNQKGSVMVLLKRDHPEPLSLPPVPAAVSGAAQPR